MGDTRELTGAILESNKLLAELLAQNRAIMDRQQNGQAQQSSNRINPVNFIKNVLSLSNIGQVTEEDNKKLTLMAKGTSKLSEISKTLGEIKPISRENIKAVTSYKKLAKSLTEFPEITDKHQENLKKSIKTIESAKELIEKQQALAEAKHNASLATTKIGAAMKVMTSFTVMSAELVASSMATGMLLANQTTRNMLLVGLGGVFLVMGTLMVMIKAISNFAVHGNPLGKIGIMKGNIASFKDILEFKMKINAVEGVMKSFLIMSGAIVVSSLAVGALLAKKETRDMLLTGFAGIGATMTALMGVVALTTVLAKGIGVTGVLALGAVTLFTAGLAFTMGKMFQLVLKTEEINGMLADREDVGIDGKPVGKGRGRWFGRMMGIVGGYAAIVGSLTLLGGVLGAAAVVSVPAGVALAAVTLLLGGVLKSVDTMLSLITKVEDLGGPKEFSNQSITLINSYGEIAKSIYGKDGLGSKLGDVKLFDGITFKIRKMNNIIRITTKSVERIYSSLKVFRKLNKLITPDGKSIKTNTGEISLVDLSTGLSMSIFTFIDNLIGKNSPLEQDDHIMKKTRQFRRLTRRILRPVSQFAELLTHFYYNSNGELVTLQKQGNNEYKETVVRPVETAVTLSSAILTFTDTLLGTVADRSEIPTASFSDLIKQGIKNKITGNRIERGIRLMGASVGPISQFADLVATYNFENDHISYLNENNERVTVNIIDQAKSFSSLIRKFTDELYADSDEMVRQATTPAPATTLTGKVWNVVKSAAKSVTTVGTAIVDNVVNKTASNKMERSVQLLSATLVPIEMFMGMVSQYKFGTNGTIQVGDGAPVNVINVAKSFNTLVKTLTNAVVDGLTDESNKEIGSSLDIINEKLNGTISTFARFDEMFTSDKLMDKRTKALTQFVEKLEEVKEAVTEISANMNNFIDSVNRLNYTNINVPQATSNGSTASGAGQQTVIAGSGSPELAATIVQTTQAGVNELLSGLAKLLQSTSISFNGVSVDPKRGKLKGDADLEVAYM